jgi:hypothetical protein
VLGDGIMALFGAPLAHEDHALRACYAALTMQTAMRAYTETVRRAHGIEMRVRVGLNSGEVVVRAIGNDLHMDYSAVGQTTHLAARMEQLATPGTIRLAPSTLGLVEGLARVHALGPVLVRGLVEPVEAFELIGVSARQDESQPPKLYFIFEGERALGDAVEYGAEVDLVFNYAVPPPEALVAFWGERFEKVLRGEAEVSITVIPEGFTFRDGVWLRTAKFSGGVLREPVRFYLQASNVSVDDPGFFVILSLYESVLYQFPISVRLVPRLDAAGPRATSGWSLNLDLFEILSEKEKTLSAEGE